MKKNLLKVAFAALLLVAGTQVQAQTENIYVYGTGGLLYTQAVAEIDSITFHALTGATNDGTSADARALVNAAYGPLQTLSSSYSFLVESATETTVSFEGADDVEGPLVSQFDIQPDNWYAVKVFNRLYSSIAAANKAIDEIGAASVSGELTQAGKDLLVARAKFVRGYDYFQLVQLYGEVPLILSSVPATIATQNKTRKSIDDVYTQIVGDLTAAIPNLPVVDANKSNPSQLAAKTVLAKAYLTWGSKPLSQSDVAAIATAKIDPAKPAADNAKLQQAIGYANEVINSGKYRLLSDFNKIWGVPNENNAEVIYSIHHDGDGIDAQGNHQTHCGFTFPTDERADSHIQYADITLEKAIPAGDARKLYSYLTNVTYDNEQVDTLTWPLSVVRPGKWVHRKWDGVNHAEGVSTQLNDIDHIDFRLAEVYLIKAEAQFYANDGDKGLAAVNALRSRAGVLPLEAISEDAIQKEWGYEFAFEQKHWINLVRWRTLIKSVLNKVPAYEYYKPAYNNQAQFNALPFADASRFGFYSRIYKHLHSKTTNIDGHQYRFPIPLSEAGNDLGITPQNPGY
ncbi:MAG: RagB/SusD family nutrient uptake outer membrane protein [Candidatus Symbiothrix sp.]|jgi:hypothetical protein|nr:RagB/SusD family nutrient uptake outer membrane protein [Candidatus Symbiothrix sp.]